MAMTRRQFAFTSAGGLSMGGFGAGSAAAAAVRTEGPFSEPMPWDGPAVVRKVYLSTRRAGWPRPDMDLKQEIAAIEASLADFARRHSGAVELTGGEILYAAADAPEFLEKAKAADALLAFNMTTGVYPMLKPLADSGIPTLLFSLPYAGHDWTHAAAFAQKGYRMDVVASSDYGELDSYSGLFRTIHHLRKSKVLSIAPPKAKPRTEDYAKQFGTAFAFPTYLDLKAEYDAADTAKAKKAGEDFAKSALKVIEPAPAEIADSMRLNAAILALMKKEKANAIAIDCLGGFGRKELPAYPCIAFAKLNDAGCYGVCENDIESTMTQLLVTPFSGKPGFVSDPVFDTSRNEVIHAHCVSATMMGGIGGTASPFTVRSHLEDHKGVSLMVFPPVGGPCTVARFTDAKKIMVSTGEVIGNEDNERGCRTKIRTRVKDARKFLAGYAEALNTGPEMPGTRDLLHRVVFYGDHTLAIERLGRLLGFKVVMEG